AEAGDTTKIAGIHSVDIKMGSYGDPFRVTVEDQGGKTVLGVSALQDGKPLSTRTAVLNKAVSKLKALNTEGLNIALDFDSDGSADLSLYDRLEVPRSYDGGGPPEKNRTHHIRVVGQAISAEKELYFAIRGGRFTADRAGGSDQNRLASSAASAVTGLSKQAALGGFAQELDRYEGALFQERKKAFDAGLLSKATYDAWSALSLDLIRLRPQIKAGKVDAVLQASAVKNARAFYQGLLAETRHKEKFISGSRSSSTTGNPYTDDMTTIAPFVVRSSGPGQRLPGSIGSGKWASAFSDYHRLVAGLDKWVTDQFKGKHGESSEQAQRAGYLAGMKRELGAIEKHNPKRVQAVFHPDAKYKESGQHKEIPLSLFVWKEGGKWHLKDLTNPDNTFHDTVSAGTETEPPVKLFKELDYKVHFPKGLIRYQYPGGTAGVVQTTERRTLADYLTYIGLGLAAVGLGLATFGTGTVAVAGAWVLAASSVTGAVAAGADLHERASHGNLDATTAVLDIAQIVAGLTGAGAIASGRIVVGAANAAAKGSPWAGAWARAAGMAQRLYVPLTATAVGSDVLTVAVMTPHTLKQLEAIEKGAGNRGDKDRAKALLLAQLAVTGGLVALSIKGSLPDLTSGPTIHVDLVDGVPVARLAAKSGPVPGSDSPVPGKWVKLADNIEVPAGSNATLEDAANLKFSQENIGPTTGDGQLTIEELTEIMKSKGWRGDPLQV
ncbi:MAG: hypothetical protein AAGC55_16855, partial [Myxococcota bacterium]